MKLLALPSARRLQDSWHMVRVAPRRHAARSPRAHAVKPVLLWRFPATARGSRDGDTLAYAAVSPTIAALPVSLIRVRDAATPATSAIVLPRMRCADDCQLRRRFQHRPIQEQLELIGR